MASRDEESQERLWEACWRWIGLRPDETVLQNVNVQIE
jgi:hypothetical protein